MWRWRVLIVLLSHCLDSGEEAVYCLLCQGGISFISSLLFSRLRWATGSWTSTSQHILPSAQDPGGLGGASDIFLVFKDKMCAYVNMSYCTSLYVTILQLIQCELWLEDFPVSIYFWRYPWAPLKLTVIWIGCKSVIFDNKSQCQSLIDIKGRKRSPRSQDGHTRYLVCTISKYSANLI